MKRVKFFLLFFFMAICVAIFFHFYKRLSYAHQKTFFTVKPLQEDTTFSIGIIGDSWVSYNKLDTTLFDAFTKKGIVVKIISCGKDGARSKQVYQSIFNDSTTDFSCKFVIEQQPDACIIIAGVNDAQSFSGPGNYAHHILLTIQALLHYNIKPVIVNLPQFDVIKAQKNIGIHRIIRNRVSALLTNDSIPNILSYRQCLQDELTKQGYIDSVVLVDFDKVCIDYKQCASLYMDALHLSPEGNKKLCEVIVEAMGNQ